MVTGQNGLALSGSRLASSLKWRQLMDGRWPKEPNHPGCRMETLKVSPVRSLREIACLLESCHCVI